MESRTALYESHLRYGARMVSFAGWTMPLHYGSQVDEHHSVRRHAGMFDVSHMAIIDLQGSGVKAALRRLLANDVVRLRDPGKALYSCMLDESGGVVDDLIVYWLESDHYRVVVNAATAESDLEWMRAQFSGAQVGLDERRDLAMVAVQGPQARQLVLPIIPTKQLCEAASGLRPFFAAAEGAWLVARTGYTGEDGFEVMLPGVEAPAFWDRLAESGVAPCGLGARDTLRLEAGMNLYGTDMDRDHGPLESGLGWTIAWEPADRYFVGRSALARQQSAPDLPRFVGLVLEGKGVMRGHQVVWQGDAPVGEITSGGYSPTLDRSIALARFGGAVEGGRVEVEIRGRRYPARIVEPPFVRHGKSCLALDA